jgi:magnesium chelatase family protein
MALARTYSVALIGVKGHVVEVESDIASGLPATVLVGLPDTALREARDRIRAAINNTGAIWPSTKITVGLSPASLPKRGSGFDAAIAVALLAADGQLSDKKSISKLMFYAELGLDGQLRPVNGVLPAVLAAQSEGLTTAVVAAANAREAALVPGVTVVGANSLIELIIWLKGGPPPVPEMPVIHEDELTTDKDMSDVLGQQEARFATEVCAAGGHNLSLLGPPGAGKTMLAERLPTILPPLDTHAALEVTSIHSVAGELDQGGLLTRPPFSAPHHTATKAAIVGGGSGLIVPGAVSLAHHGILFLDEAPEFDAGVLDALRQPLESGEVVLARSGLCTKFPARFSLVLASNPCPCAEANGICECTPMAQRRYLAKLSGPLRDRVDVKVKLEPVTRVDLLHNRDGAEPSAAIAARVRQARDRAARRYMGTTWRLNARVPGAELRRNHPVKPGALLWLDRAMESGQVSARGADKVMRVAWTLADLAGKPQPGSDEMTTAIGLWLGVRK